MDTFTQKARGAAATDEQILKRPYLGGQLRGACVGLVDEQLGYSVTVVEIAKSLRKGGTPVNIREGVIDVVRRMGLLERIQAACLPPRPVTFLDAQGEPLSQASEPAKEEPEEVEYEIERDDLLDMLFSNVKDDAKFVFGESIADLQQSAEDVAVTFNSGRRQSFSLVLGCDGTHSAVRKMCFGDEASFVLFLQNYFSLTIVDKLLLDEDTSEMFSVPGRTVMLNAYNGKTDIAFCFSSEREIAYDRRDREEQKRMILEHFQGAGWKANELLDEMNHSDDFYFDQLCQVRMPSWAKGRVALVGDAGYCPSPAAGMGGSTAILGAAALADALQRHPEDFEKAFQEYDANFRPTMEAIQAHAVEVGLEMFMPKSEEAIQRRNTQLGLR